MRVEGGGAVWIDAEDLVEAGDLEDGANGGSDGDEAEFATVVCDALHGIDEDGEAGTVDVADLREIDEDVGGFCLNERAEGLADVGGLVKVDFALEGDDGWLGRSHSRKCIKMRHAILLRLRRGYWMCRNVESVRGNGLEPAGMSSV